MHRILIALCLSALGSSLGACVWGRHCPSRPVLVQPCPTAIEVPGSQPQVFLDMTVVEAPEAGLATLLGATLLDATAPVGADQRVLSQAEATALYRRIQGNTSLKVIAAPKLLALAEQEASVFVGETDARQSWTGFRAEVTPRLTARPNGLELDVSVLQRRLADAGTQREQRVEARAARLESGQTLLLLGPPAADGGVRFLVTVSARVLAGDDARGLVIR